MVEGGALPAIYVYPLPILRGNSLYRHSWGVTFVQPWFSLGSGHKNINFQYAGFLQAQGFFFFWGGGDLKKIGYFEFSQKKMSDFIYPKPPTPRLLSTLPPPLQPHPHPGEIL